MLESLIWNLMFFLFMISLLAGGVVACVVWAAKRNPGAAKFAAQTIWEQFRRR